MQYLGPKHFMITSKMIECRIKSGSAIMYTSMWQFKIKKEQRPFIGPNIFVICLEQFHKKTK